MQVNTSRMISTPHLTRKFSPEATQPTAADSFTFSNNTASGPSLSLKQTIQSSALGIGGAAVSAIPFAGAGVGVAGAVLNGMQDDQLGLALGVATAIANVGISTMVIQDMISPFALALPALLGGAAMGGFALTYSGM